LAADPRIDNGDGAATSFAGAQVQKLERAAANLRARFTEKSAGVDK